MIGRFRLNAKATPLLAAEINASFCVRAFADKPDVVFTFHGSGVVCRPRDPDIAARLREIVVDAPFWDGDALLADAVEAPYLESALTERGLSVELVESRDA